MIYPEADKLEKTGSKYALVVLAAMRAKQIKSGVQPTINTDSKNPLTIALEEIAAGTILYSVPDNDLIVVPSLEPEVAQLLAIPIRDEETEEEAVTAGAVKDASSDLDDDTSLIEDDELAEDWEDRDDSDEDEVLPLDQIDPTIVLIGDDTDAEDADVIGEVDEKPKTRGRKKAAVEPEIDIDLDIDIDDIDIDLEDVEETEEAEEE